MPPSGRGILEVAARLYLVDEQAFDVSQQFSREPHPNFDVSHDQSMRFASFIDAIPSSRFRAVTRSPAHGRTVAFTKIIDFGSYRRDVGVKRQVVSPSAVVITLNRIPVQSDFEFRYRILQLFGTPWCSYFLRYSANVE